MAERSNGRDDALYRVPPHNFEAEQALLGAMLTNNRAYEKVVGFLRPEHFADKRHGAIYGAAATLIQQGQHVDAVLLHDHFAATGELDEIGGASYLARLAASTVSVIGAEAYGHTVWDRAMRRTLIEAADQLRERAFGVQIGDSADAIAGEAVGHLTEVLGGARGARMLSIAECADLALAAADSAMRSGNTVVGVPTGLSEIDQLIGGLKRGRLVILAGRPGMGKSTLAVNIGTVAASRGYPVAYYQLEMMADEMGSMAVACMTGLAASRLLRGEISVSDFGAARNARDVMATWPLWVDTTAKLTVAEMRARSRALSPGLIIVDHLLLSGGSAPGQHDIRKVELTGLVTGALKQMAKDFGCPVLALCQLKRPGEGKEDQRPHLEDLKWAGEIEQDADDVLLLYRPHYYLARATEEKKRTPEWRQAWEATENLTEVIIGKNRGGAGANRTVKVWYDPAQGIFRDLDRRAAEEPAYQGRLDIVG